MLLEKIEQRDASIERALLDGAGTFPPEDCGGISGFLRLNEFFTTGKDPWGDDESLREWTDGMVLEDFDVARESRGFGAVLSEIPAKTPRDTRATESNPSPPASRVRSIDRGVVDDIVQHVDESLEDLRTRLGLVIRVSRASFSEGNAKISLEAATVRDDGIVMDKQADDFLNSCREFGLEPENLGRTFRCGEDTLRVVGLRPRAKQPVVCEMLDQKVTPPRRVGKSALSVRKHMDLSIDSERKLRLIPPRSAECDGE